MNRTLLSLLITFTVFFQGCINDKEPEGPSLVVGDSLPVFSVVMNNGEMISTTSLKGYIPVIVFFNTNCGDCRKEFPVIQQLWDIYKDNEFVKIVLISREEGEGKILEYWKENNLTMPFSAQENRDVYSLFAQSVIPRIYIADTAGIIKYSFGDTDLPTLQILLNCIETADPTVNLK